MPAKDVVTARTYVFYGRSGSGKTTLFSTFPKPALLLDFKDEGTDSVSDVEDLYVKRIADLDDFEAVYWHLKKNPKKYKSVGLDTMTALQQMIVEDTVNENKKDKAGDWGTMTKRQWGDVAQEMKSWITKFRDLAARNELEVVFIAQDRTFNAEEESDDDTQLSPEVGPRLSPSIRSHLNAAVSVIANTFIRVKYRTVEVQGKKKEKRQLVYCLRLGPNPVYDTKVRKPRRITAPDTIEDPRYEDILEVINGE